MSLSAPLAGPYHPGAGGTVLHPLVAIHGAGERLRLTFLTVMMLGGAFVFAEPSPYELGALAAIVAFAVTGGIILRAAHLPLLFVLLIYCFGLTVSSLPVLWRPKVLTWTIVSWYLAATALFFAAILAANTETRIRVLMKGWTIAALIAAIAGILGYFRAFPGAFDLFTLYGRAKGTFNDPNVFAPFIILPMLLAVQAFITGTRRDMVRAAPVALVLLLGLLLSFSRGAWLHFALSVAIVLFLHFVTARGPGDRARIILMVIAGSLAFVALLAVILSIDKVAELMKERATLNQSYDAGPMGRFGRHALGWQLALDRPLGIGPLQFSSFFPEDAHNVYLNSFMAGGWLSGLTYPVLVAMTAWIGFATCLVRTPWQPAAIALFATFIGLAVEGKIIDTEHWRHFWALVGMIWGLALATRLARRPVPG